MKNDYGSGPDKISIPPTLLFSLFGDHPDVRKTATSDFKFAGDRIYLVGSSKQELGASELAFMLTESGEAAGVGGDVPRLLDPEENLNTYRSLSACIRRRMGPCGPRLQRRRGRRRTGRNVHRRTNWCRGRH